MKTTLKLTTIACLTALYGLSSTAYADTGEGKYKVKEVKKPVVEKQVEVVTAKEPVLVTKPVAEVKEVKPTVAPVVVPPVKPVVKPATIKPVVAPLKSSVSFYGTSVRSDVNDVREHETNGYGINVSHEFKPVTTTSFGIQGNAFAELNNFKNEAKGFESHDNFKFGVGATALKAVDTPIKNLKGLYGASADLSAMPYRWTEKGNLQNTAQLNTHALVGVDYKMPTFGTSTGIKLVGGPLLFGTDMVGNHSTARTIGHGYTSGLELSNSALKNVSLYWNHTKADQSSQMQPATAYASRGTEDHSDQIGLKYKF